MTNMEHAMKQAGVAMPLIHRVWLAVKDHPGADCGKISAMLKVSRSHVSSSLADLSHRKMVDVSTVQKKVVSGKGFTVRPILTYTVPVRMVEYELLPRKHKPRTKHKVQAAAWPAAPTPAPAPAPTEPLVFHTQGKEIPVAQMAQQLAQPVQMLDALVALPSRMEMDQWPLADAKKVYDYLRTYFS